ncbi:MAG TPA: hypothetical protein VGK67_06065 [Myxococcales bacterium]
MGKVRLLRFAPWLAALACLAFIASAFYPGYMSSDTTDQLNQARTAVYGAWHPPVMAWWWRQVDHVVPGPLGMLLFHCGMFFTGLTLVLTTCQRPLVATLGVLGVGLFPSVAGLLSTVWKDVGMASALLLGFALVLRYGRRPRWPVLAMAALALLYAIAVRKNGAAAAVPIAVWAGVLVHRHRAPAARGWLGGAVGAVAGVALFVLANAANTLLVKADSYQSQQLALHDLAAISLARNEVVFPEWVKKKDPRVDVEVLRALYTPNTVCPLLWGDGPRVPMTGDEAEYKQLMSYWLTTIRGNLGPYLKHRLRVSANILGLDGPVYAFESGIYTNPYGYKVADTGLNRFVMAILRKLDNTVVFKAWAYVALTLVAFGLSFLPRLERRSAVVALFASSVCFFGPYLIIGPANDFRLVWWSVLAALVLPFLVFSKAEAPAAAAQPEPAPSNR